MQALRTLVISPRQLQAPLMVIAGLSGARVASSPSEGIRAAAEGAPDITIIAWETDLAEAVRTAEAILAGQPASAVILVGPALDRDQLTLAMQAGIREVLPAFDQLPAALHRARSFLERLKRQTTVMPPPAGKIVVVHAPRGGCGKSTLATSLAIALGRTGGHACLVDLEPQFGSLDLFLNVTNGASLADLARLGKSADAEALRSALTEHSSGVRLLGAASTPEEAELVTAQTVAWTLQTLKEQAAWVVVDTGSQLSETVLRAMELADRVVVPVTMDMVSLRTLQQAMRLWEQLGLDPAKVELAAYRQPSQIETASAERVLRRPIDHRLGWDPQGALSALNAGEPLLLQAPNGPFAAGVHDLAARLSGIPRVREAVAARRPNALLTAIHQMKRMLDVPTQPA